MRRDETRQESSLFVTQREDVTKFCWRPCHEARRGVGGDRWDIREGDNKWEMASKVAKTQSDSIEKQIVLNVE